VLTHELGHTLGIGHSTDPRATMAPGLPAGIAARSLEDDDIAAVCTLYPSSPPVLHGCDRGDPPCPTSTACVGHDCERNDDPGTNGGPCATSAFAKPCDGAGDRASCETTSVGDRCALPCPTDPKDDCGEGLACLDGECLPIGATIVVDAGPDGATSDAASGDHRGGGGGCAIDSHATRGGWLATTMTLLLSAMRRRRRARSSTR
jgi:hypothetical protein